VCYSPKQRPTLQQSKHTKRPFSDKEEYTLSKSLAFPYNDKFDNKLHTCEEALEALIISKLTAKFITKQPDK